MKFSTDKLNIFGNILQISLDDCGKATLEEISKIIKYCSDPKKKATVELKRERRSLNANAYMWVMCHELAKKLSSERKKYSAEDVYRRAVAESGLCIIQPVRDSDFEKMAVAWSNHGIGWFIEKIGKSLFAGYSDVAFYHGSSVYDGEEMSRLIDGLVQDCHALGIDTRPQGEIDELVKEWGLRDA